MAIRRDGDIADEIAISAVRLFHQLKGIGGFELAKRPEEITMGQIVRFFDGLIAPIGCVSATAYEPCSQESSCRFRRIMW